MDIVIEAGGLRDATASEYRDKSILLDVTYADPQAGIHMRAGSADRNGSAASNFFLSFPFLDSSSCLTFSCFLVFSFLFFPFLFRFLF